MATTTELLVSNTEITHHSITFLHFFIITLLITIFLINIFFCWSLYLAMKNVSKEKRVTQPWLCWLILIPLAGFVFQWILLPFTIPNSFKKAMVGNEAGLEDAHTLFNLGLSNVILGTTSIIAFLGVFSWVASFIIWIIYWVKIVKFKKNYLLPTKLTANPLG